MLVVSCPAIAINMILSTRTTCLRFDMKNYLFCAIVFYYFFVFAIFGGFDFFLNIYFVCVARARNPVVLETPVGGWVCVLRGGDLVG